MRKYIAIAVFLTLIAGGYVYYTAKVLPNLLRFKAVVATQFYAQAVTDWSMDYSDRKNNLPYPFPKSFDDLLKYKYLTKDFIDYRNKDIEVEFTPQPKVINAGFIMITAKAPTATWVVRITKSGDTSFLFGIHEDIDTIPEYSDEH